MANLSHLFMFTQLASGAIETLFNQLIHRSPQVLPLLRKLAGKNLKISLKNPDLSGIILFSETRIDWLNNYEGELDCEITLQAHVLPKLTQRQNLSQLINEKSLILQGDIQILQHFTALLDELEKDPAELLSPFLGDVVAQISTDFIKNRLEAGKAKLNNSRYYWTENLTQEYPVLVHKLQAVHFYDEIAKLAAETTALEQRLNQFLEKRTFAKFPQDRTAC